VFLSTLLDLRVGAAMISFGVSTGVGEGGGEVEAGEDTQAAPPPLTLKAAANVLLPLVPRMDPPSVIGPSSRGQVAKWKGVTKI
jgi:hypothetical protein